MAPLNRRRFVRSAVAASVVAPTILSIPVTAQTAPEPLPDVFIVALATARDGRQCDVKIHLIDGQPTITTYGPNETSRRLHPGIYSLMCAVITDPAEWEVLS